MEKIADAPIWAQYLLLIPLGVALLVAAVTDWRERKVYNWLTYPLVIVGLILHTIAFGLSGLIAGGLTAVIVLIVGLIILPFGWFGGGDIKLMIAIGATVGPAALFEIFFYSLFIGLLMGLSFSLVNGYLWTLLKRIGRFLKSLVISVSTRTNVTEELVTDERAYLPFAIPLFVGAVFATTDVYLQWPLFMDWLRESMQSITLI